MIKCNVEDLIKDLDKLHKDTVRRLEQMVRGFTYQFALTAIDNTPLGDDKKYMMLYKRRLSNGSGLLDQAGFAQGSWQVPDTVSGDLDVQELYSGRDAANVVQTHMLNYTLGETITLGNTGPYIGYLESGQGSDQAPEGIIKPTIDQVLSTYKIDLVRYYQQN
jgi:hypothetical protein